MIAKLIPYKNMFLQQITSTQGLRNRAEGDIIYSKGSINAKNRIKKSDWKIKQKQDYLEGNHLVIVNVLQSFFRSVESRIFLSVQSEKMFKTTKINADFWIN